MTIYTHKIHRRGVFYEKGNRENADMGDCHCTSDDNCVQKSVFTHKRRTVGNFFRLGKRQYVGTNKNRNAVVLNLEPC